MTPFTSNKPVEEEHYLTPPAVDGAKMEKTQEEFSKPQYDKVRPNHAEGTLTGVPVLCDSLKGEVSLPETFALYIFEFKKW